ATARGSRARRRHDRVDDRGVPGATADVAAEELDDLFPLRPPAREQISRGGEDPRRAEAALQRVMTTEHLLQRPPLEAFDRHDLAALRLHSEGQARADAPTVEEDGAGAADAVLAADVRAGQPELVAEEVGEQRAGLAVAAPRYAVDRQLDHAANACASARSATTPVTCFKYSGDACRFPGGSTAAAAAAPAARAVSASAAAPARSSSSSVGRSTTEPTPTRARRTTPSATSTEHAHIDRA